ncbi:hypothetical protein [Kineosporia sp. A_224]|uniref:hypothetical protein n=1 Tax=Kineosporia sp. A_224 TaxID=1962180 RepID=UPI00117B4E1E|nr:hypothetical protein [Kineosporia sp. A_224]
MLLLASVGLLGLGAAVAVRWAFTRVDALGRPVRFPVVAVAVPVVVALVLAVPVARRSRTEHRLSDVASVLAGRTVHVDCSSSGAGLVHVGRDVAHVDFDAAGRPGDVAVLGDAVCDDVERWRRGLDGTPPARADVEGATAVHVLTHEAMHLGGRVDEGQAECAAVQRDAATARMLGADDVQARRLARTYWLVVHPTVPEPYRTSGCAAGQGLDEHLADAPWVRQG